MLLEIFGTLYCIHMRGCRWIVLFEARVQGSMKYISLKVRSGVLMGILFQIYL